MISQKLPSGLMFFVTLHAHEQGQTWLRSFGETKPYDLRPASVAASSVCMTRPQAGVITPVPSTVRSGTSMAQMDRRRIRQYYLTPLLLKVLLL